MLDGVPERQIIDSTRLKAHQAAANLAMGDGLHCTDALLPRYLRRGRPARLFAAGRRKANDHKGASGLLTGLLHAPRLLGVGTSTAATFRLRFGVRHPALRSIRQKAEDRDTA